MGRVSTSPEKTDERNISLLSFNNQTTTHGYSNRVPRRSGHASVGLALPDACNDDAAQGCGCREGAVWCSDQGKCETWPSANCCFGGPAQSAS